MRDSNHGFTLIELMITVVVLAILLAIGVPSFREFYLNNRITSNINMLNSHVLLARSAAIKRNRLASLCSNPGDGPACGAPDWSRGWVVFIDRNGDGIPNLDTPDGCAQWDGAGLSAGVDDCILAVAEPLEPDLSLTGAVGILGQLTFDGAGAARCPEGLRDRCYFTLCDERGREHALALLIGRTGHSQAARETPTGEPLACEH